MPYVHSSQAFEIGVAATGVSSRVPQHVVQQAALTLRQLLDSGVSPEDPRCRALLQLVNTARLLILPTSNNGAKIANDLTSKAAHIDVSTATVAAIMGLKNVTSLTGAASAEISAASQSNSKYEQSSSDQLRIKLLPKPSQRATDALFNLVKNDADLGTRARNEAVHKTNSMAHKMHKLRAGQRHAIVRKRRLMVGQISDQFLSSGELPSALPPPLSAPMSTSMSMPSPPPSAPVPAAFQKFILPRRNTIYSTPVQLPIEHIPSSPRPGIPSPEEQIAAFSPTDPSQAVIPATPTTPQSPPQPQASSFARFRGKQKLATRDERVASSADLSCEMDVVTDEMVEPGVLTGSVVHPVNGNCQIPQDTTDNPTKIRSILTERERILFRLVRRRQSELAAMPLGMTEQTRRKAIIEAKQLSLLDLQRAVRLRVCAEMKKMSSLAVQEDRIVPPDSLSRLYRRRDPPTYTYTDGYPRITRFDGIPDMQPRPSTVVAQDSVRMAQFDMSRMLAQKKQRRTEFNEKLILHYENFRRAADYARNCRARIAKGFERHFLEKKRIEEKKRKMERVERLRLLRSNDEQAYLNLLKDTKNERLLQLVRQTDSYLMRIGAQVEKAREQLSGPEADSAHNAFAQELGEQDQVPIDAMRRRRDLYYTVTHAVQEEVRQPSIMVHGTLKPYQVEGLKWMVSLYNNNLNGILADEMGLGKTIQTISLITYLVEVKKNPGPYLIIVPLSTMGNWVRELELWAPSLNKVCYSGDRVTRRTIQQRKMSRGDYNVLLTTYEFTLKDQQVLSRIHWQYIIIDEGHRMKNANCKLAMTLGVKYKSRNRLLLTGTPLQNNLTELWALLNFLLPTIFASSDTFETWFKQPFESTTLGDTTELEEEETLLVINRLHQVLRPFLLRRLKTDVESQLPQKVEHVIRCDMSAWQRVLYRQVQSRIGLATGEHNGSVKAYNNLLMQCKKICNHPYLFYDAEAILDLPPDYLIRASGKFFLLQHMLPKLRLHGHRTLIFSQMTAALDYLEDFLTSIGVQYLRLDGNTRAGNRQELLNSFNAKDSPYFCFLLSTRAGGLGLNLQTADTVIIFDSDWNPMMDLQAQDRAHRIGQTKIVRVYRLICSGTVEVKILEKANQKLQVDAQVIQAGQFNNKSTETDRTEMLKDLLRQRNDEGDELGAVPDMEELNRLFARSDGEFESFCKYDEESWEMSTFKPLFESESELPAWVLQPDVEHKTAEEKEQEILQSHGRGRRRRKSTAGLNLTDSEWLKVMEGELTVEEVLERRKRRALRILARNEKSGQVTATESESLSAQKEESSEPAIPVDARETNEPKPKVDGTLKSIQLEVVEEIANDRRKSTTNEEVSLHQNVVVELIDQKSAEDRKLPQLNESMNTKLAGDRQYMPNKDENRAVTNEVKKRGVDRSIAVPLKLRVREGSRSDKEVKRKALVMKKSMGSNGIVKKRRIIDVEQHQGTKNAKKLKSYAAQLPSEEATVPQDPVRTEPRNVDKVVGQELEPTQSNPEKAVSRKRKRASESVRSTHTSPHLNGSIRTSRRKKLRTYEESKSNGRLERGEKVNKQKSSASAATDAVDVNNLDDQEVPDSEEKNSPEPQRSVILKLRVRKEGRRRRSTYRM